MADILPPLKNTLPYVAGYYLGMYCECPRRDYHGEKFQDINRQIVPLLHSLTKAAPGVGAEIDSPSPPCLQTKPPHGIPRRVADERA